ncbi:hypothetical protein HNR76_003025 [Pseudoxanthomonas broegbernensis]|nr:hypothetical protein [Pseudoxanthomonas broegbernensis]
MHAALSRSVPRRGVWPLARPSGNPAGNKKGRREPPPIRPEPEDIVSWHGSGQGPDGIILAPRWT